MIKGERKKSVESAYQLWLRQIKQGMVNITIHHPLDDEKFYVFMRKLMGSLWSRKYNISWFEKKLESDLSHLKSSNFFKRYVRKFDTIFGYERGI